MSDLKLDSTHDLAIEGFDFVLVSGAEQLVQRLTIRLRTFLGEYFRNTTYGIPYLEEILIKNPNENYVETIIRSEILSEPGVDTITEFTMDYSKALRTLSIKFSVKYGAETVTTEVLV